MSWLGSPLGAPGRPFDNGFRVVVEASGGMRQVSNIGLLAATSPIDVTDRASALRYSLRLPGGYGDCSFTLAGTWLEWGALILLGDKVTVLWNGTRVWEGYVEEIPRQAAAGALFTEVVALGASGDLKRRRITKLFIETGYGRWKHSRDVAPHYGISDQVQLADGTAQGTDGICSQMTAEASVAMTNSFAGMFYQTPPGCYLVRLYYNVRTNTTGAGTNTTWGIDADDSIPTTVVALAETIVASGNASLADAAIGASVYTFSGATRKVIRMGMGWATFTPTAEVHVRLFGISVIGAKTADGNPFTDTGVTSWEVVRTLLSEFGGKVSPSTARWSRPGDTGAGEDQLREASFTWSNLVFEQPTVLEDAITTVNAPVGWEWGVFGDNEFYWGPMEFVTTFAPLEGRSQALLAGPPWWLQLRAQDGHAINLTTSLEKVVNRVVVSYTDYNGLAQIVTVSDFANQNNPLNTPGDALNPKTIREEAIQMDGAHSSTEATAYGNAYLMQYGNPVIKGSITISGNWSPIVNYSPNANSLEFAANLGSSFRGAPSIMPGWWVHVPDAGLVPATNLNVNLASTTGGGAQSNLPLGAYRLAPLDLLPIRAVDVDCDANNITLTIDSSRSAFETALAQVMQGTVIT